MKKLVALIFCCFIGLVANAYTPVQLVNNKIQKDLPKQIDIQEEIPTVLTGSVSLSDKVPKGFFGSWKVIAVQTQATQRGLFDDFSIDYWNLYKIKDVITLENPVNGANASITINDVQNNTIKFTRQMQSNTERVTETPVLTLSSGNNIFIGSDKIMIETLKNGQTIRTDVVVFKVKGYKIYGNSLNEIIGR